MYLPYRKKHVGKKLIAGLVKNILQLTISVYSICFWAWTCRTSFFRRFALQSAEVSHIEKSSSNLSCYLISDLAQAW